MNRVVIFILGMVSSACASVAENFVSPPEKNMWVKVHGVMPYNTQPKIYPQYTSSRCTKRKMMSDATFYNADGWKTYPIEINFDKSTGKYKVNIPLDGGTSCEWSLKRIIMRVSPDSAVPYLKFFDELKHLSSFKITGQGVSVDISTSGDSDLTIEPEYYPRLSVRSNTNDNVLFLEPVEKGELNNALFVRDNVNAGEIIFSPKIDEKYVVYYKVSGSKLDGTLKQEMHYPNGDVELKTDRVRPYKYYENSNFNY
ncbi:hypothetical protein MNZ22_02290 [Aeromonas encheleia]|uniref:hypothetical protein n=1 Tax=Aeromonas encheleia TaxID=73010 RepID=UPI001F5AF010|nr:hypothetical protein [Aeromonas encheleia]UNP89316.1 hypothetical protein MNZ22_02290 [Aeromonas encheleia]